MKLQPGFNPEENRVTINVETNLLVKYYQNFVGLVKSTEGVPSGINVKRCGSNVAEVSFPVGDDARKTETGVAIDSRKMEKIQDVINDFVNSALRHELKRTEFIPLTGYPLEDLQNDVKNASKAKRNLCIIGDYDEYLRMEKDRLYEFHQIILEHGTSEWADAILMILEGNKGLEELKKIYEPKLDFVCWF